MIDYQGMRLADQKTVLSTYLIDLLVNIDSINYYTSFTKEVLCSVFLDGSKSLALVLFLLFCC